MTRTITILDYGKDYGFGRYSVTVDDGVPFHEIQASSCTNPQDALKEAVRFLQEVPEG